MWRPNRAILVSSVLVLFLFDVSAAQARKDEIRLVEESAAPNRATPGTMTLTELTLGSWDFEDVDGGPNPQGWLAVDATDQGFIATHVDDFAGLGGGSFGRLTPIAGTKSLWCGKRTDMCTPNYPGYGNNWAQYFTSNPIPTSGNVTVAFDIVYDTEFGYDIVSLEYQRPTGAWSQLASFSGIGDTFYSAVIPVDSIAGSARIRFHFVSDGVISDGDGLTNTDGAYILDNIQITDGTGPIHFQNFETEPVNQTWTSDGQWFATSGPAYGNYTSLFSGSTVLQEDPVITNNSHLWGFFQNSEYDYACGGHPEQLAVPYSKVIDGELKYLDNEIWSPPMSLAEDVNGFPVSGTNFTLSFDVYGDLPLDALVMYRTRVRSLVGGCWGRWRNANVNYFNPSKTWFAHTEDLSSFIDLGATEIQVAISVRDLCPFFCGTHGSGACHSHGPLIDNVKVTAPVNAAVFTVTNTNDSGAGSLRQAIIMANGTPGLNGIAFDIPGAGPHVINLLSSLDIIERASIDGYTQTGASPNTNGQWEGSNAVLKIVLNAAGAANGLVLSSDQCKVRGLVFQGFTGYGIYVQGDQNAVEGCIIGLNHTGTIPAPCNIGIQVIGAFNVIGGDSPADRNVISANTVGVILAGTNSTVVNNFVGTDISGTVDLGNGDGIRSTFSANVVWKNLVSGNVRGIWLLLEAFDARVRGNYVGTDVTGTLALGNSTEGIFVGAGFGAGVATIGGPGGGNLIAFNGGAGISASSNVAVGLRTVISQNTIHSNAKGITVLDGVTTIQRNSIYGNTGLGIDLGNDGVTANDVGDGDIGPNGNQNYPVLSSVVGGPSGNTVISGSLSSTPSQPFVLEFFASPACDGSSFGEGEIYLGQTTGSTDGSGLWNFAYDFPFPIPGGYNITATAAVPDEGTSEFAACYLYFNTPSGSNVPVTPFDVSAGQFVQLNFANVTGTGNTTLTVEDTGPPPPGAFTFGDDPAFYDLNTTASFTGTIDICFFYDETLVTGLEDDLKVLHYDETLLPPAWVDVTVSVDTDANILCGQTTSLSPFVMAMPVVTGVGDQPKVPSAFALHPAAPNPFNPITTIRYDVPVGGAKVSIIVYDVTGRRVRTLVDGVQTAGQGIARWDGRDEGGQPAASGVYFYRMSAGTFVQTRKMVLLK